MKTIKVLGQVDDNHRLVAQVPTSIAPGPVEVDVRLPEDDDDADRAWAQGVAREWESELNDPHEDIYTLADGEPVNEAG